MIFMNENYGIVATEVLHLMKQSIKRMYVLILILITLLMLSIGDSIYQRCRIIDMLENIEKVEEEIIENYEMNADVNNNIVGGDNNGEINN